MMKSVSMALLAVACMAAAAHASSGEYYPYGYPSGYPDGYTDGYPGEYSHQYPDGYTNEYPYGNTNGYPNEYPYGDPNGYPNEYPYGDPNGYPGEYSHGYPNGYPGEYPYGYPGENGYPPFMPYRDPFRPITPDMIMGFCEPLCNANTTCYGFYSECGDVEYEQTGYNQCSPPVCNPFSKEARWYTLDGSCNNFEHPSWGAANTCLLRLTPPNSNQSTVSPKDISDALMAEKAKYRPNTWGVSAGATCFGQFIAHETSMFKDIMNGDEGPVIVSSLSQWMELSTVYGNGPLAKKLRYYYGGLMRISKRNGQDFLPYVEGGYKAGDSRSDANPCVSAIHLMFLKNHNYLATQCMIDHGYYTYDGGYADEYCFQRARSINIAHFQSITYEEYVATLVGEKLPAYTYYDKDLNGGTLVEFASAAFRIIHAAVYYYTEVIYYNEVKYYPVADNFFKYDLFDKYTAAQILKGSQNTCANRIEAQISDALRKFDFPGKNDMFDLLELDIIGGRLAEVPTMNELRETLGMRPYSSLEDLVGEGKQCLVDTLEDLYGPDAGVDDLDLLVAMLVEKPANLGQVGATVKRVIQNQFYMWRNGDRLFYKNPYAGFSEDEIIYIDSMKFADLVNLNTDEDEYFAPNAFYTSSCCYREGKRKENFVCKVDSGGPPMRVSYCDIQEGLLNGSLVYPGTNGFNCNCVCEQRNDGYPANYHQMKNYQYDPYYTSEYEQYDPYYTSEYEQSEYDPYYTSEYEQYDPYYTPEYEPYASPEYNSYGSSEYVPYY